MLDEKSQSPAQLDYATADRQQRTPASLAFKITLALIGIVTLLYALRMSGSKPQSPSFYTSKCASNLHQIGLGILMYTYENGGAYPDSLQTLAYAEGLPAQVFVCPRSGNNPSTASTTQGQIGDMAKAGHVSYIYLGKGLTDKTARPNQVIVYEPLANHGDGIGVLFGDGTRDFIDAKRASKIIAAARATNGPVMLPPP